MKTKVFRNAREAEDRGRWGDKPGCEAAFYQRLHHGYQRYARDIPLLLYLIYHYALNVPHLDKRADKYLLMENEGRYVRNCASDRPTLLTGSVPAEVGKLRVG